MRFTSVVHLIFRVRHINPGPPALLASLSYPCFPKGESFGTNRRRTAAAHRVSDHLRVGCDLIHLYFLIDEYTDIEPAPIVREMADIVFDAFNNPDKPRPEGEVILGEVARQ